MRRLVIIATMMLAATAAWGQTTQGTDFWAVFMQNKYEGYGVDYSFVATGPDDAAVRVENQAGGWDTTVYMMGGGVSYIHVPTDLAMPCLIANTETSPCVENIFSSGFHVSSSAPISLYASDYAPYSYDIATILPTAALQSHYIAQHHNGSFSEYMIAFAATEDGTVLTMRLPCNTRTHHSGDTLNVALQRGETLTLYTNDFYSQYAEWFSGMEVTSNGHPFAMFNGAKGDIGGLDYLEGYGFYENSCMAGDHCYEQALPVGKWGRSYLLASPASKTGGDWVAITSSADSCLLRLDGDSLTTLQRDSSLMLWLPADTVQLLTASQPISATLFFTGGGCNNHVGDPSSVTLPPLEQATVGADFYSITTEGVTDHYVNITATAATVPHITLDGQPIGQHFTPYNSSISYARLHIGPGAHHLRTTHGSFTAWFYGLGYYESYSYTAAMALRPQEPQLLVDGNEGPQFSACQGDTVELTAFCPMGDTVAVWTIDGVEIADSAVTLQWCFSTPGPHCVTALLHGSCIVGWCDTISGCIEVNPAALTILPNTLCIASPCIWHGVAVDSTGTYADTLRTVNGCDSVVMQYIVVINPADVSIAADRTRICEGDTVIIHVSGIPMAHWQASPADVSLAGQTDTTTIMVTPRVTTDYWIAGADSVAVTIEVLPTPQLCIELKKDYIDFDDPVLDVADCSEGSSSRQWLLGDGTHFTSQRVHRRLRQPLPDSLDVALHTCNALNCCADTTLWLPVKIQSVWFPNIFIPGYHDGGGFGCRTSLEVDIFELNVFNRQGMMIWKTEDVNARWDGGNHPQGTYVYRYYIKATTGRTEKGMGTVTLVR